MTPSATRTEETQKNNGMIILHGGPTQERTASGHSFFMAF